MCAGTYMDAALILVGHGSTVNADSSAPLRRWVEEFRRRRDFGEVRAGLWKEDPRLSGILDALHSKRVFVVPFFVSEGYFTEEQVPLELGFRLEGQNEFPRVRKRGSQTFFYGKPVGTHPRMTEVILSRARSVVEQHPFPRRPREQECTLFIAGHGTGRNSESRRSVERQADLIRQRGGYADVQAVFMEEAPRIEDCYRIAATRYIVMVPFFLSDGLHVGEDIPVLLGEPKRRVKASLSAAQPTWRNPTERHHKLVWYSSSVGTDPEMAGVILERVQEAASWSSPEDADS